MAKELDALVARDFEAVRAKVPPNAVVISPDLGAVKRAELFARPLGLNVAVVHKQRLTGSDVQAQGVVGEVNGLHAIVVDDMISTAGTLVAAVNAVMGDYFDAPYPARSTVQVSALPRGAIFEVDAVLVLS